MFFPVFFDPRIFSRFKPGGLELDHQQTLAAYAGKSSDEKLEIQMQVVKFRNFFQKQKKRMKHCLLMIVLVGFFWF